MTQIHTDRIAITLSPQELKRAINTLRVIYPKIKPNPKEEFNLSLSSFNDGLYVTIEPMTHFNRMAMFVAVHATFDTENTWPLEPGWTIEFPLRLFEALVKEADRVKEGNETVFIWEHQAKANDCWFGFIDPSGMAINLRGWIGDPPNALPSRNRDYDASKELMLATLRPQSLTMGLRQTHYLKTKSTNSYRILFLDGTLLRFKVESPEQAGQLIFLKPTAYAWAKNETRLATEEEVLFNHSLADGHSRAEWELDFGIGKGTEHWVDLIVCPWEVKRIVAFCEEALYKNELIAVFLRKTMKNAEGVTTLQSLLLQTDTMTLFLFDGVLWESPLDSCTLREKASIQKWLGNPLDFPSTPPWAWGDFDVYALLHLLEHAKSIVDFNYKKYEHLWPDPDNLSNLLVGLAMANGNLVVTLDKREDFSYEVTLPGVSLGCQGVRTVKFRLSQLLQTVKACVVGNYDGDKVRILLFHDRVFLISSNTTVLVGDNDAQFTLTQCVGTAESRKDEE